MRSFAVAVALCAAWASSVSATQMGSMFRESSHDFGTVAKAAKTEHRFYFDNPYNQPIHVRSVRTSCGCTTPIIETETVPPGGRGSILARFNTGTHSGARAATVTVTFDRPSFSEIQLHVKGYIRTDVVFQPGEASFGTVAQGDAKSIDVAVDYAGKPDWRIQRVASNDSFITVEAKEVARQNGRVRYNLTINLAADAPAGPLESEIVVYTNDRNLTTVPLRLVANVLPEISASPSLLSLGDISVGDEIKQIVILKGQMPFRVLSVDSDAFTVQVNNLSEDSRTVYPLPLVLTPKEAKFGQELKGEIIIKTDLAAKPEIRIGAVFRLKTPIAIEKPVSAVPFNELRTDSFDNTTELDENTDKYFIPESFE